MDRDHPQLETKRIESDCEQQQISSHIAGQLFLDDALL